MVEPTDADRRWFVTVAERLTVSDQGSARATLTGTAAQLYLGLWNRGDEIVETGATGDTGLMARWRKSQRIRWS